MYDNDVTTWSPLGRLHQIEYATEAVSQGSACVGLKSKKAVVIGAIKRQTSELSEYQEKIFHIDDHMGIAMAGLTADARLLCKYMRGECLSNKYVFDAPLQVETLIEAVADKSQINTQEMGGRPYGVGLLVAGFDKTGAHLFETTPSGAYYDYKAQAMGARSQSARTYLEKKFTEFDNCSNEELIMHALTALAETMGSEQNVTVKNCCVGIVGEGEPFRIIENMEISRYVEQLEQDVGRDPAPAAPEGDAAVPMDAPRD